MAGAKPNRPCKRVIPVRRAAPPEKSESCVVAMKLLQREWSEGGALVRVSGETVADGSARRYAATRLSSSTLTLVRAPKAQTEPDSESRIWENRPFGSMRGEVAVRD